MAADAAAGLFFCATVGTTSTTAVDPVGELAAVAKRYGAWVQVDAAYAGSACICPEFQHHLDGVETADSVSMSPHKCLLSHLDRCCLWVQNAASLTQALSNKASELRRKDVVEYKDWQVGVGRRFGALCHWMVLRSYGAAKLRAHIRSDVEMEFMFEGLVREDGRFEVVVPRRFALVCFRLATGYAMNRRVLEEVNATGRMYATHTVVTGFMCCGSPSGLP